MTESNRNLNKGNLITPLKLWVLSVNVNTDLQCEHSDTVIKNSSVPRGYYLSTSMCANKVSLLRLFSYIQALVRYSLLILQRVMFLFNHKLSRKEKN